MNNKTKILRLPEINLVTLLGRLTKDPDLKRTNLGQAVCSFTIALSKRIKDTTTNSWKNANPVFVPIVVWGGHAEKVFEKLKKGIAVYVQGRLKTNKWISDNGKLNSRLEIIAYRVQYLSGVNINFVEEDNNKQQDKQTIIEEDTGDNIIIDDDSNEEVPF
jgi:single-strand DNA-binding protein